MCCQQGKANCIKRQCPTSASGPWFQPRCLQEAQTAGTTDRLSTTHQPLEGATNGLSYPQGRLTDPNLTLTFQPTGANAGGGLMDKSRWWFLRSNMGPGLLLLSAWLPAERENQSFCLYGAQANSAWVLLCGQHTPVLASQGYLGRVD